MYVRKVIFTIPTTTAIIKQVVAEARELVEIAEKNGLIFQVGHVERFNGAVLELTFNWGVDKYDIGTGYGWVGRQTGAERADGVRIYIGSENKLFSLSGSSLVLSPYRNKGGQIVGVIGVIGPTRLNYARIIPMVDYTARVIGQLLS